MNDHCFRYSSSYKRSTIDFFTGNFLHYLSTDNSQLGELEAYEAHYLLFEITVVLLPLPSVRLAQYYIFEVM
jgi:hypothetical protein